MTFLDRLQNFFIKAASKSRRGEPIDVNNWFHRRFLLGAKNFDKHVLGVVKSVSIAPYISIAGNYKRMWYRELFTNI